MTFSSARDQPGTDLQNQVNDMKNKGFDLILTDGYVVAEMLKLPVAGKEVGVAWLVRESRSSVLVAHSLWMSTFVFVASFLQQLSHF